MKRLTILFGVVLAIAGVGIYAQPPRGADGTRDRSGPDMGPPGFTLMIALDVDKDGKISAKEIDNATATLKKLDKDGDGKLSTEEIGWPPEGGFGGRGGSGRGGGGGGPRGFFGGFFGGNGPQQPDGRPPVEDDQRSPKKKPAN